MNIETIDNAVASRQLGMAELALSIGRTIDPVPVGTREYEIQAVIAANAELLSACVDAAYWDSW